MAAKALPDAALLRQRLDYNPETGALTWKWRDDDLNWSARWAGKPAGSVSSTGRLMVGFKGHGGNHLYQAHRLIWKLVTGEDPEVIDHIDGDPLNNRWSNLRSVSRIDNARNAKLRRDNKSGAQGVGYHRASGKYYAEVGNMYLGVFVTREEAIAVRVAAEQKHGFHPNHGRTQQ